ncbi:MAG: ACT domain-containing protein [Chthoniobacteraceae bacterium]
MEIVTQLSVFLANEPGTLAAVCDELAKHKINIYALTISDTVDHAVVRMVLSEPIKAIHLLESRGVLVVENRVLMIHNSNKPGSLSKIAAKLAKAKINIEYAYLATAPGEKRGLLILRTSDTKRALTVLKKK